MEFVAPAGSFNALKAAVAYNADAVYLGLDKYSARAKAENFTLENLKSAVDFAHLFGTKVYLAMNTLIKKSELDGALNDLKTAVDCGIDSLIVQDFEFIQNVRRLFPKLILHASTQMGIHNYDGAMIAKQLGITRVVVSRETLPEDIIKIKKSGVEVEYFVHGALCVAFSGNCYFSSLVSSYSGNRGKCLQLCRKPYCLDGNKGYLLSAKDICLIDKIDYLQSLGVDACKIEGRLKAPEYVANALDNYKNYATRDSKTMRNSLKRSFNRGDYCEAYIDTSAKFSVIHSKLQGNKGIHCGYVTKIVNSTAFTDGSLKSGDGVKILRDGKEICGLKVSNDGLLHIDKRVKVGDEIRLTLDSSLVEKYSNKAKLKANVLVNIEANKEPTATVAINGRDKKIEFSYTHPVVSQVAMSADNAVTNSMVEIAFAKTLDEPIDFVSVKANINSNAFLPISALNGLRRGIIKSAIDCVLSDYKVREFSGNYKNLNELVALQFGGNGLMLLTDDLTVLDDEILTQVDYIAYSPRDYNKLNIPQNIDKKILLNMPIIARGKDIAVLDQAVANNNIYGIIANNLYALKYNKPILLGYGMNILSGGNFTPRYCQSIESDTMPDKNAWLYAYGSMPLMTLCHCFYSSCKNCKDNYLTDELGNRFRVYRYNVSDCYNRLINSVPTDLLSYGHDKIILDCTFLNKAEIISIIQRAKDRKSEGNYTRSNHNKVLK